MIKVLLSVVSMFICITVFAQEMHEHPDHPKGNNSQNQYLALPYYNEACELYSKGEVEQAKQSLKQAINKSFALTEAQMFLGTIYYEQEKWDSAFIFLNSGIDFAPHQKPHFFFYCFDASQKTEQYYWLKQNLKHFKKYYGKIQENYEKDYPFNRDDFERYEYALKNVISNYQFWKPSHRIFNEIPFEGQVTKMKDDVLLSKLKGSKLLINQKNFSKSKRNKIALSGKMDFQRIERSSKVLYSKSENGKTKIYLATLNGKKIVDEQVLSDSINRGNWNAQAFYSTEHKVLFFVSDALGSKDLYSVQFNPETNELGKVIPLSNSNTKYDEMNPRFENGQFYFCSNGHPGFGGFDLYATPNFVIENNTFQPSGVINMGKPINSGADELKFFDLKDKKDAFVRKSGSQKTFLLMNKLPKQKGPEEFEIKIQELWKDKE